MHVLILFYVKTVTKYKLNVFIIKKETVIIDNVISAIVHEKSDLIIPFFYIFFLYFFIYFSIYNGTF